VPHLVEVWGQRFTIELEPNVTVFRYRDLPGMLGRVGSVLGAHGVNIDSAAVGRQPPGARGDLPDDLAAMVVTTREPVSDEVLREILAADGWVGGKSVAL
jgi:D-3-phosphoglycerate dehydrogenase